MKSAELHCHSYYSFLEGASSPSDLVDDAVRCGITALALTDRDGLYGVSEFYRCCKEAGIHPIIGAQLTLENNDSVVVLCRSMEGYRRLSHLITDAYAGREKGEPCSSWSKLAALGDEVFILLGGKESRLWRLAVEQKLDAAREELDRYSKLLPISTLNVELNLHLQEGDRAACKTLARVANERNLPTVASNAVRYGREDSGQLYDVLLCIKHRKRLAEAYEVRSGNNERYLKGPAQMRALFADFPQAIERAIELAEQCRVEIDFSSYRFPNFEVPEGETTQSYLMKLCEEALPQRYAPEQLERAKRQLDYELGLIDQLDMSGYFLIVWDIVRFARSKNIPCQGRGSAANSLVAYVLRITPVDPIAHNLYLGRFIHEGMTTVPDIDLDFASSRHPDYADREDVIQYIYKKYTPEHVTMVCTFVTFQKRSAIREIGRVLGLPDDLISRLAKLSGRRVTGRSGKDMAAVPSFEGEADPLTMELFWRLLDEIQDIPRHPSIHVGGMLIASKPISDLVPIEPARMEGRSVCQWDKDMVDDAGLIKVDILGLGMLAVLRETVDLIDEEVDIEDLSFDDPEVYKQITVADTVGIFQVESRAQMQSLPRTRPSNFQELGVQVAIIRPGPLQGNMVSPYILRKQGKEKVTYLHPSLEPILKETLGVILFQEQVLQVATVIADFTQQQAADLRRAMSRKRSQAAMAQVKVEFLQGAKRKGISMADAERIFATLEGFALYGFCKSHALAFARIAYVSAWLRRYYPAAFAAALLNNQPMGFYSSKTILEDAKRHGIGVLAADVNMSSERCIVENGAIRLGLSMVHSVSHEVARKVVIEREENGPYWSLRDLRKRSGLNRRLLEALVEAGACDGWGIERRELLWQLWMYDGIDPLERSLFEEPVDKSVGLPLSGDWDRLYGEYRAMGLSASKHPVQLLRPRLKELRVCPASGVEGLKHDDPVRVGGMVICLQKPPTAKGFAFMTLEDEFGMLNVIVAPKVYEEYRMVIKQHPFLVIDGICQKQDGVTNIRAQYVSCVSSVGA